MDTWDSSDSEQLTKLYVHDKLELLEICRIMKRKCKVIIGKLIELQIVKSKYEIRGNNGSNIPTSSTSSTPIPCTDIVPLTPSLSPSPSPSPSPCSKTLSIVQVQNETIQLLDNVNKIITQASIICSNYSKLISSVKNIYSPNDLNSTHS